MSDDKTLIDNDGDTLAIIPMPQGRKGILQTYVVIANYAGDGGVNSGAEPVQTCYFNMNEKAAAEIVAMIFKAYPNIGIDYGAI